jgi:hypothetical protein
MFRGAATGAIEFCAGLAPVGWGAANIADAAAGTAGLSKVMPKDNKRVLLPGPRPSDGR